MLGVHRLENNTFKNGSKPIYYAACSMRCTLLLSILNDGSFIIESINQLDSRLLPATRTKKTVITEYYLRSTQSTYVTLYMIYIWLYYKIINKF